MKSRHTPGLTPRSLAACLLGLFLMGSMIQVGSVVIETLGNTVDQALPIPAVIVFLILAFLSGALFAATRFRLLARAEALCVFYALMLAAPVMGKAFWQTAVGLMATLPRSADFEKLAAMSDKLWPHGDDILRGAFDEGSPFHPVLGGSSRWLDEKLQEGATVHSVSIEHTRDSEDSSIRIELPLHRDGRPVILLNEPYMITIPARATGLGPEAAYYCRIYYDDLPEAQTEVFLSRQLKKRTYLLKDGFVPVGSYGLEFDERVREKIIVEFGLGGKGKLQLLGPRLVSVGALERALTGVRTVSQAEYESLPDTRRAGLVMKPDNPFSWAWVKWLLAGYIPVRDWIRPAFAWLSFLALLMAGMLAINSIMRAQWMDSERHLMPMARIPLALLGEEEADSALPPIWKNRVMWLGFGVSLLWCLIRLWRVYNPNVPDLEIQIPLDPYFKSPEWGAMWTGVVFTISLSYLSLAVFLELNVLISLAVGFLLFRAQYWVGETVGWTTLPTFPFPKHQTMASYFAYAFLIIVFSRRHLWMTLRQAVTGGWRTPPREIMSYRMAHLLLALSILGIAAWGIWLGGGAAGMTLFFLFLLMLGFVSAKLRSDCGTPYSQFTPYEGIYVIPLLGGIAVFQPMGWVTSILISLMLCRYSFFILPGLQLELLELGKRMGARPRHLVATSFIGLVGGFLIGGWLFLSNSYSMGGDTMRSQVPYRQARWYFNPYSTQLTDATNKMLEVKPAGEEESKGIDPSKWAMMFAVAGTVVTSILRQIYAGFWFHPVGFILGPAFMPAQIWGSALAAWGIRLLVLKLGGAATVRSKLLPFFTGVFLATVVAYFLLFQINAILYCIDPGARLEGALF